MLGNVFLVVLLVSSVTSLPQTYEIKKFKVGIEYEHSLPMNGGSDRYRHRNNYDPFFVTVTASAKNGFVISYLEVTATVDASGEVDFCVTRGSTGSRNMVFRLASNHSDFLAYSYLAYGIREEEYKKVTAVSWRVLDGKHHNNTNQQGHYSTVYSEYDCYNKHIPIDPTNHFRPVLSY